MLHYLIAPIDPSPGSIWGCTIGHFVMMIALFVIVEMVMVVVVGVEFSWVFFTSIACFIAPVVFICLEVNLVFPEDPVKENSGWVIGGAQCRILLSQMCRILNLPHSGVRNGYVPTPRKKKYVKKFLEMIRSLQLLIRNDVLLIWGKNFGLWSERLDMDFWFEGVMRYTISVNKSRHRL